MEEEVFKPNPQQVSGLLPFCWEAKQPLPRAHFKNIYIDLIDHIKGPKQKEKQLQKLTSTLVKIMLLTNSVYPKLPKGLVMFCQMASLMNIHFASIVYVQSSISASVAFITM